MKHTVQSDLTPGTKVAIIHVKKNNIHPIEKWS